MHHVTMYLHHLLLILVKMDHILRRIFFFLGLALISDFHSFLREPATDANSGTGALDRWGE